MRAISDFLAHRFPELGRLKRLITALSSALLPVRPTYSQNGEDLLVMMELKRLDIREGIYIDVGANHPSHLSNTYLFYRSGFSGVLIEPIRELCNLNKRFRSKDVVINVGCSSEAGVKKFVISKTPVLSSFREELVKDPYIVETIAVLRLDDIVRSLASDFIFLLSVDAEGFDFEVLRGAEMTLEKTLFVIVEGLISEESTMIVAFLIDHGFTLFRTIGLNYIFRRSKWASRIVAPLDRSGEGAC